MSVTLRNSRGFSSSDMDRIVPELKQAGLSNDVIEAAWPLWWHDELASDPAGHAELRFTLARRLGLSPKALLGERVEFIWPDEACFKYLSTENALQRALLASFGRVIGRLLVEATPQSVSWDAVDALDLRQAVLADRPCVDLHGLLSICWAMGIPVIHLGIFPLSKKAMHAMVVRVGH